LEALEFDVTKILLFRLFSPLAAVEFGLFSLIYGISFKDKDGFQTRKDYTVAAASAFAQLPNVRRMAVALSRFSRQTSEYDVGSPAAWRLRSQRIIVSRSKLSGRQRETFDKLIPAAVSAARQVPYWRSAPS
jgi:hypothetical protein